MNEKEVLTEVEERRRRQSSLLSAFEEIVQTFLSCVNGARGNATVFNSLQDYLDSSVLVNGAYWRRRTVLLAVHDLKEELEAPSALQSETLAKLELLHLRPVPQVTFYRDIATAVLRMEVVIRLEAMQPGGESEPCLPQSAAEPTRWRWWMPKLGAAGYGLAAAAFCAGALIFLQNGSVGDLYAGAPVQLAAQAVEKPTDSKWRGGKPPWRDRGCFVPSKDDGGKQNNGNACAFETSRAYDKQKAVVMENSFNAAEFVMYSAFAAAALGSVIATSFRNASPVRETPRHSSWATRVEAGSIARPARLSEVKTR